MNCKFGFCLLFFGLLNWKQVLTQNATGLHYKLSWNSLDKRSLPEWYDNVKIGIFIHWGVYSVPSFGSEWFWFYWHNNFPGYGNFMNINYPPGFSYQNFGPQLTAEMFDPNEWADLFESSGARYVVLTSKHHDGYCLWPSKYSNSWNSMDVGPQRDIVAELAQSIRTRTELKFGLYYSLFEWFNPLWLSDKSKNFKTNEFVLQKTLPELYELVNRYKPDVLWADGESNGSDTYWNSQEFLTWLFNSSPVKDTIVVNDRWGNETLCKHGDFYTCMDRYNPEIRQTHKFENAMTIDKKSWGYRRDATLYDYMSTLEILREIVSTVSCGGNILINIGPTKEGRIIPIFEERFREIGQWLATNGEAIYFSKPWSIQNDTITPEVWYTSRPDLKSVYFTFFIWPKDKQELRVKYHESLFREGIELFMLGFVNIKCKWRVEKRAVVIELPSKHRVEHKFGWTFKI